VPVYCPVRDAGTYFGDGTPYQHSLLSQWRYAVHLLSLINVAGKSTKLLRTRCVSQVQSAPKLDFGQGSISAPVFALGEILYSRLPIYE